jgi:hypothetical protein
MEIIAAFPSVPYAFSTLTNTFSGESSSGSPGIPGHVTLTVLVDQAGDFTMGSLIFRNLDHHLLLLGHVARPSVEAIVGDHFFLQFPVTFEVEHLPGLDAETGVFWAFICRPGDTSDCGPNGPDTSAGLFTTTYTAASVPLNSYLIVDAIAVPAPPADLLLGASCLLALVVGWIRKVRHRRRGWGQADVMDGSSSDAW